MTHQEALEWLQGKRSMTNMIPQDPFETWLVRIAEADAHATAQAYWIARAWKEQEMQAEIERLRLGYERYETARRMNPQQWADAWKLNISTGKAFDEIIDDLRPFVRTEVEAGKEEGRRKSEEEIRERIAILLLVVEEIIGRNGGPEEYDRALIRAGELRWVLGE